MTIQVKIELLGENCPGGIQDKSELTEIKSRLRKIESVVEGIQG